MDAERKSRKRQLTAEEAELWTFAMREAKALRRREQERLKAAGESAAADAVDTLNEPLASAGTVTSRETAGHVVERGRNPPLAATSAPPLARFDDRQRRKLARDPELIDARLDLHGMRQREAHSTLRRFLVSCAAHGHRHVLIITGKGARAEIERVRDHWAEERGVLRRLVPQWLGEPELRHMVISYTSASTRHGGEGAFYVRLRKTRGAA